MGTPPPPPPQTSSLLNSYTLLFSFSDRPAWLEYKALSATMLTSTREYYNKEYREGFPRECLLTAAVSEAPNPKGEVLHSRPRWVNIPEVIPTVFLYFIYRSRPPKLLKYVKNCQKQWKSLGLFDGRPSRTDTAVVNWRPAVGGRTAVRTHRHSETHSNTLRMINWPPNMQNNVKTCPKKWNRSGLFDGRPSADGHGRRELTAGRRRTDGRTDTQTLWNALKHTQNDKLTPKHAK